MDILDAVRSRIRNYDQLSIVERETAVEITPPNDDGFRITVIQLSRQATVVFGEGWHEIIADPHEAAECVAFGLSDKCRLRTTYRGDKPYQWALEHFEDGEWREVTCVGWFALAFWRPKRITYRQNRIAA